MKDIDRLKILTCEFQSPTLGVLKLEHVLVNISEYIKSAPAYKYKLIIGTDSEAKYGRDVDFITAIVVHRIGAGGVYFWRRSLSSTFYSLKERIYQEAIISMEFAQNLFDVIQDNELLLCDFEIHLDVGKTGETREIINEVAGMIRSSGFEVKTKPESFGASKIADRYT